MPTELLDQVFERLNKNGFKPEVVEPYQYDSERKVIFKVLAGEKEFECKLYEEDINEELIDS